MTFEELRNIQINKPDQDLFLSAKEHWNRVAKPLDSLGAFEDMISRIASIRGTVLPDLTKKALLIMCGDNGIVSEGVSQSGQEVTAMVASMMGEKKSSVGILTKQYPMEIFTYDVGMACEVTPKGVIDKKICRGTQDFLKGPAMSKEQCLAAIRTGIEAVQSCREKGIGILATGEMGIGNTTTSTALLCALCGIRPEECAGRGAGLSDAGLATKIRVIREGLQHYRGDDSASPVRDPEEAFRMLQCLGGFDLASLAGCFIGGAMYGIPVVIDGLISAVAALTAERLVSGCRDFMIASHRGREKGMELILRELSLRPVIVADLALGEGSGAVMLFPLLDMALSLYTEGTTFQAAAIDPYERQK